MTRAAPDIPVHDQHAQRDGERGGWPIAWLRRMRPQLFLCRILVRERQVGAVSMNCGDGVSIRVATPVDLDRAVADLHGQLDPGFLAAARERGDVCLAAFHAERMIAFVWRSFTMAPHEDDLLVRVDPPYWYTYKMYTHPDFRGQRLSGMLTLLGDTVCADRGRLRGVGFIEIGNAASLRANLRVGSRIAGYAGYVRLFGRVFPFRTPGTASSTFRFCRRDT